MKAINCRISKVTQISDDTLYIDIEAEKKFSAEDFHELRRAALQLGNGESFYNIINVGEFTIPDKKAREASCSIEGSYYKKADAFVINSLPQKIVANFMLRINKPVVPTKIFQRVEAAEDWIKALKKGEHQTTQSIVFQ
jgi:hypothetical protein